MPCYYEENYNELKLQGDSFQLNIEKCFLIRLSCPTTASYEGGVPKEKIQAHIMGVKNLLKHFWPPQHGFFWGAPHPWSTGLLTLPAPVSPANLVLKADPSELFTP